MSPWADAPGYMLLRLRRWLNVRMTRERVEAAWSFAMREGQQRKRLIKLARRVPDEAIREFVEDEAGNPLYFVLVRHGFELLCGWHSIHGVTVLAIDDDVLDVACVEYLKQRGLVFRSEEEALEWKSRSQSLPKNPS